VFVEKDAPRAAELERLKVLYYNSELSIEVVQEDARVFLPKWCSEQNWDKTRAVVFLDPYASQADWAMLEAVSKGKVDLWLLWPIGQVINRLLTTKAPPPPSWGEALTRAFGTDKWKSRFYSARPSTQMTMFEEEGLAKQFSEGRGVRANRRIFHRAIETAFRIRRAKSTLPLQLSEHTSLSALLRVSQRNRGRNRPRHT